MTAQIQTFLVGQAVIAKSARYVEQVSLDVFYSFPFQ